MSFMILKRTYSIHILLAIFIFTNGCGTNNKAIEVPGFSSGAAMKTVQDISDSERNVASSICLAFKSKSQNFKTTDFLGTRFDFQTKQTNCGVAGQTAVVSSTLALNDIDSTFQYTSNASYFNKFVQTNTSGYLSQVCSKIDNNQAISNTTTINGITVQIIFFKDTLEGYTVQYFTKLADGTTQMTSAETFKFRTTFTYSAVDKNIMGMDEYYSKETACATDSTKSSKEEQTFMGRK